MRTCVKSVVHGNLKPFAESSRVVRRRGTADLHLLSQAITETFNRKMWNSSESHKLLVTSTVHMKQYTQHCYNALHEFWVNVHASSPYKTLPTHHGVPCTTVTCLLILYEQTTQERTSTINSLPEAQRSSGEYDYTTKTSTLQVCLTHWMTDKPYRPIILLY